MALHQGATRIELLENLDNIDGNLEPFDFHCILETRVVCVEYTSPVNPGAEKHRFPPTEVRGRCHPKPRARFLRSGDFFSN